MASIIREQPCLSFTHYGPATELHDMPFEIKNTSDRNPYIKKAISFSIEYLSQWVQNYRIYQNTLMITLYRRKQDENYDDAIYEPVSILLDHNFQRGKRFVASITPHEEKGIFLTKDSTYSKTVNKTIVTIKITIVERLQNISERFKEVFDLKKVENLENYAFQFNFKLRKRKYKFDEEDSSPWTSTALFSLKKDNNDIIILSIVDKKDYHTGS